VIYFFIHGRIVSIIQLFCYCWYTGIYWSWRWTVYIQYSNNEYCVRVF